MEYEVLITAQAEAEFDEVIAYLESNSYFEAAEKLTKVFFHVLSLLERFPYMYPAAKEEPTLRRAVILSKSVMYYRIEGNKVVVKSFLDGRRERAGK